MSRTWNSGQLRSISTIRSPCPMPGALVARRRPGPPSRRSSAKVHSLHARRRPSTGGPPGRGMRATVSQERGGHRLALRPRRSRRWSSSWPPRRCARCGRASQRTWHDAGSGAAVRHLRPSPALRPGDAPTSRPARLTAAGAVRRRLLTERSSPAGPTPLGRRHPGRAHRSRAVPQPRGDPMPNAVIVDAVRTPGGKRNGKLSGWHPADLAAEALKAARRAQRPRPRARRRRDHGLRHAGRRTRRSTSAATPCSPPAGPSPSPPPPSTASAARRSSRPTSPPRASSPAPTTSSSPPASRS